MGVPPNHPNLDQSRTMVTSWDPPCYKNPPIMMITLWLFNIAMENGPFLDGLPITNSDFPWLC